MSNSADTRSTNATVIRVEPQGPNGLEEWEPMDHASLVSGAPVQRGHLYHEIESQGYSVGVWDFELGSFGNTGGYLWASLW